MRDRRCLGIFRERAHSPGREFDDAEILRLTAKHLEAKGFQVRLIEPDEVRGMVDPPPPSVMLMCERRGILDQLRRWEIDGVCHVNSPVAVLNTYRDRMVALIEESAIPFPRSLFVDTASADVDVSGPVWVKRGDVHNTQEGDVVFAPSRGDVPKALRNLADRGIPRAVIQEHVPGDLIKFYGVGDPVRLGGQKPWFLWFYHRDQDLKGFSFDAEVLGTLTQRAAAALGLEVYGGDAIAGQGGRLTLIDLNAWPSFALYREEASGHIASYLEARFTGRAV